MKKVIKAFRFLLKVAFFLLGLVLVVFLLHDQRVPDAVVGRLCRRLSSSHAVVHCEQMTLGFRRGIFVRGLRVFNPAAKNSLEAFFSAETVSIRPFRCEVTAVEVKFPRLSDSYYAPDGVDVGGGVQVDVSRLCLPDLPNFRLLLVRPQVLGIVADRLSARVYSTPRRLDLEDIVLEWPESERRMALRGSCAVDLDRRRLDGRLEGMARQSYIRPLMVALDLPIACTYIDAFTGVTEPVPSGCGWDVDLGTGSFSVRVDLHPELGRYNGVPMRGVDGQIVSNVRFTESGMRYKTTVGPLTAHDRRGGTLDGQVSFDDETGSLRIRFDASSSLGKADLLDVIDCLNDGMLDCLNCATPPKVTVAGDYFPFDAAQSRSDLRGTLSFGDGTLFGIPLKEASCDWGLADGTVIFTNAFARGEQGGRIYACASIRLPELEVSDANFQLAMKLEDGHLGEFAGGMGIDFGERYGDLSGELELSGPVSPSVISNLNGRGTISVRNGHLAQMKLFLGLTEMLAEYVPGVSAVVNQSQASADFTITNGVIASRNILLEGALFSIRAEGRYDRVRDDLDFVVQVRFLKDENALGRYLIRPILWPFTKLLLEYRVTGGIETPKWEYISLLDRVL